MYKFNGGRGACICDVCRIIIRENIDLRKVDINDFNICPPCMTLTYDEVVKLKGKKIADKWLNKRKEYENDSSN